MFADTHAHLTDEKLFCRIDEVINDAAAADVGLIINVGYDLASSRESARIAQKHPNVYFAAGLHPTDGEFPTQDNLGVIKSLLTHEKCVAVGEIGLDYHYGENRVRQMESFTTQLAVAAEYGLPVSVHARDCTEDMLSVVAEWHSRLPAVVLHCYSMSAEAAQTFTKYGCYFAFGGAITFKNNKQAERVAAVIPTDRLLTETDCPYMAPVPKRGEVNEPKYVRYPAEKLAVLYGIEFGKMQEILINNTLKVFNRIKL